MRLFGLCGSGGFAREVMPIARQTIGGAQTRTVFVDRDAGDLVNGSPTVSTEAFLAEPGEKAFNVAIGNSALRQKVAEQLIAAGASPLTLIAPSAIRYDGNEIGEGAILCANTMITSNAQIGRFFHLNIYAYVAHDCVIGDFVTFAPRVMCNGNVRIGDHAYIGTGAILRQGEPGRPLVIGEGAIIGMGAVVTRDVPPYTTVVGNPARPLVKTPT